MGAAGRGHLGHHRVYGQKAIRGPASQCDMCPALEICHSPLTYPRETVVVPGFTMGSAIKCAPYLVSIYQEASILWKLDPNSCFIKIAIEETAQLLKYLLRKCKDLSSVKTQGMQGGWRLTGPTPA